MPDAKEQGFHSRLKTNMDSYVHKVYNCTKEFPEDEKFGARSQIRRSAMSVMLNYIEGYARQSSQKDLLQFLGRSYGSLKESEYIINFSQKRKWMPGGHADELNEIGDEIGKMLWSTINNIKHELKE